MELQNSKVLWLLMYYDTDNINNNYIQITIPWLGNPVLLSPEQIKNIFFSTYDYKFDFRSEFNKIFYNPVYFLVRTTNNIFINKFIFIVRLIIILLLMMMLITINLSMQQISLNIEIKYELILWVIMVIFDLNIMQHLVLILIH